MKNLLMSPTNHPPPHTPHRIVNTHSSGEPGCQCHLQITLQANQGRNQDKHFCNCPKHIPVLEENKGNDLSLWCWPVQCCCTPGQQVLVSPPPGILCTWGADAALMHFVVCILGVKEGIFILQYSFSPHAQQSTTLTGKDFSFWGNRRFWKPTN